MDDLVEWLRAQLDEDEENARAADVKQGDPEWWVSPVLASGNDYTVRSERDNAPIARVRRLYDDDGRTVVLDGRAVAEHIARHDPARVLREIDAKRQVLTEYEQADRYSRTTWGQSNADQSRARTLGKVVRLLALAYEDRPGYLEEWRP
jgi:hypothetical protein